MEKINVLSIAEDRQSLELRLLPADLDLDPDIRIPGTMHFAGEIYRAGRKLFIQGKISGQLELTCARCLDNFSYPLESPVDLIALPADAAPADGEPGELACVFYRDDQLDLGPELRAAVILAIPMKPLCRPDCPGLCPQCGQRMSGDSCPCQDRPMDGPFAILKNWRPTPDNRK